MNYWEEKTEFWKNKTNDNPIYEKQKAEIAQDLVAILENTGGKTILDVGGYDGHLGTFLPEKYAYQNVDISKGFDITKDWSSQGIVESKKYDILVISLVFLTIPPEEWPMLVQKIINHAKKAIYIYEEDPGPDYKHGQQINEEYGGKWAVTLTGLIGKKHFPFKAIKVTQSKVNPKWVKYIIQP